MSLEYPAVDHSEKNAFLSRSWVVIWVDRSNILPVANCLQKLQKDTEYAIAQNLVCSPEETLRLLYTIQYLTYNVYYGNGGSPDRKIYSFPQPNTGRFVNSIEQYIEFVESIDNELLGWRIHYLIQDTKFSYESALENYWKSMAEVKPTKAAPIVHSEGYYELDSSLERPRIFHPCKSRDIWIDYALNPYTGERLGDGGLRKSAFNLSLTSTQNSASAVVSLTFSHSVRLINQVHAGRVKPEYLDINNYRGTFPEAHNDVNLEENPLDDEAVEAENDEEEEADDADDLEFNGEMLDQDVIDNNDQQAAAVINCVRFPFGAYMLEHEFRKPEYFFNMDIVTKPVDSGLEPDAHRRKQRLMLQKLTESANSGAEMAAARQACNGLLHNKTKAEIEQIRNSREILDMFRAVCLYDDLNPGGQLVNKYCEDQRRRDPNWSIITNEAPMMDETLTPFGNRMARELYMLELKCGVDVKHSELLLTQIMTLAAFDVEDLKLRIHVLFHGPASAGKSYILDMHEKLSPQNLVHWIAMQTRKANTTEECFNGMQMVIDELNEMFTSKGDGQGLADVKTLLSKGELLTEMAAVDERRRRILLKTVSQRKCQYICNTNEAMSNLPAPVADRFLKIYVPVQHRHDFDPAIEDEHARSSHTMREELEEYQVSWLHRYVIANKYFTMNRMSSILMPSVDTSLIADVSMCVFNYLREKCGIKVDTRDRQRILAFSICCCLFNAIKEVFFSGRVIPAKTPYSDAHLFYLIPYLQVSREQFYFAISLFHPTISDPSLPFIVEMFKRVASRQADDKMKYAQGRDADSVDYNFLFFPVRSTVSRFEVTKAIASEIISKVDLEFDQKLNLPTVIDFVKWLTRQHKEAFQYDASNKKTTVVKTVQVATEREGGGFRPGLEISRDFIDSIVDMKEPLIISAIKSSIDKYCDIPRFVTGLTYRYGLPDELGVDKKYIFPFVFNVIETNRCPKLDALPIRNPDYARNGADFLAQKSTLKRATQKYIKVSTSVDKMALRRWYAKHGEPHRHTEAVPKTAFLGDYPMGLISGCLLEYGVYHELPSTDTREERAISLQYLKYEKELEHLQLQMEQEVLKHDIPQIEDKINRLKLEMELCQTKLELQAKNDKLREMISSFEVTQVENTKYAWAQFREKFGTNVLPEQVTVFKKKLGEDNQRAAEKHEKLCATLRSEIFELERQDIDNCIQKRQGAELVAAFTRKRKWLEMRIGYLGKSLEPGVQESISALQEELRSISTKTVESVKRQRFVEEEEE